jgi:uncharacterized membrane protein
MRIKSNTILTGVIIVLGIIIFVGGIRSINNFNSSRDSTDANAMGGSILICIGLAGLIYGTVTIRDDILHKKLRTVKEVEEERNFTSS